MELLSWQQPEDCAIEQALETMGEMDRYFPQQDRLAALVEEVLQQVDCDALDDEQLEAVAGGVHYFHPFDEPR